MASIADSGRVTLPAYIEVNGELVLVGDIEVAVDIRTVGYTEEDGIGLHAVLDLSVED